VNSNPSIVTFSEGRETELEDEDSDGELLELNGVEGELVGAVEPPPVVDPQAPSVNNDAAAKTKISLFLAINGPLFISYIKDIKSLDETKDQKLILYLGDASESPNENPALRLFRKAGCSCLDDPL
jgi:hypothetical protein